MSTASINPMFGACALVALLGPLRATGASAEEIIDQDGDRITVLRAFVRSDITVQDLARQIALSDCALLESTERDSDRFDTYECSDAVTRIVGARPMTGEYRIVARNGRIPAENEYGEPTPLVEVQTVMSEETHAQAEAIGFSLGSTGGTLHEHPRASLVPGERVTLAGGGNGVVHRFFRPYQTSGTAAGCVIRRIAFKPYVSFRQQETVIRSWDDHLGSGFWTDYTMSNFEPPYTCTADSAIDRSDELLR